MQTDSTQQLIRKLTGYAAGGLVALGLVNQEGAALGSAAVLAIVDFGWWLYWNRTRPKAD